jgi:hypothetical protein
MRQLFDCKRPECPSDGVHTCPLCNSHPGYARKFPSKVGRQRTWTRVHERWKERESLCISKLHPQPDDFPFYANVAQLRGRPDLRLWQAMGDHNPPEDDTTIRAVVIPPKELLKQSLAGRLYFPRHINPWHPTTERLHFQTMDESPFLYDSALMGVFPNGDLKVLIGYQPLLARVNYFDSLSKHLQTSLIRAVLLPSLLPEQRFRDLHAAYTQQIWGRPPTHEETAWI